MLGQLPFKTSLDEVVIQADLGQLYLIALFFKKIILVEIQYKIYNDKLFAIINIFQIWC